jgi:hypothetical protein
MFAQEIPPIHSGPLQKGDAFFASKLAQGIAPLLILQERMDVWIEPKCRKLVPCLL